MSQMKERAKASEKELNETEASNLPDIVFKTMVIRMLKVLSENTKTIKKPVSNEECNICNKKYTK